MTFMLFQKRKPYKKRIPTGPANTAGEAIEKMLVEKRISSKINYEVLRDLETSQSNRPSTPVTPVAEPVLPPKQEFLVPRVPTRTGGRKRYYLRAIYTVRLCRMRQAYDRPTTRIVSCKSNLQVAYDCRVRHKKSRRILKHVLKSYDNRRYRQC